MPISINGSGTITGISAGGLPDGIVDADMLASGAITSGSLPAGSILQVQSVAKTDAYSATAGSTPTLITGLTVNITPASTDNKVLIIAMLNTVGSATYAGRHLLLRRDSTSICIGDADGSRNRATMSHQENQYSSNSYGPSNAIIMFLDSPATTSQVTYGVAHADTSSNSTIWINRSDSDSNTAAYNRTASTLTVMEVAG